jgi:hypothetical protein
MNSPGCTGFVPEPQGDDGSIDARLQQIEGHRVAQDMYGDALSFREGQTLAAAQCLTIR